MSNHARKTLVQTQWSSRWSPSHRHVAQVGHLLHLGSDGSLNLMGLNGERSSIHDIHMQHWMRIPVVPARGGVEVALRKYYKTFHLYL